MIVLAIDPGRDKCGVAVVGDERVVLFRSVVSISEISSVIADLLKRFDPAPIVMGKGTGSRQLAERLKDLLSGRDILFVDEDHTTLDARNIYFKENPPRGLLRLVPRGLLSPKVPIDDYVAVLLAHRFTGE